jgi:molybdate transport system substrate-binding protein
MTMSSGLRTLAATVVVLLTRPVASELTRAERPPPPGHGARRGSLTVLAASSLTETFTELGQSFEAAHRACGSASASAPARTLASQITQGAPADVFAAANPDTMSRVSRSVGPAEDFATNTLEIAVPAGNPSQVTGLADFADADRRIAVCAAQVPCGAAAVRPSPRPPWRRDPTPWSPT